MLYWVANEEHAMGVEEKNRKLRPQSASRAKGEAECVDRLIRGSIICNFTGEFATFINCEQC